MYRSSYALILTTLVNAVLGVLFWVAAARLYPTDIVGLGAGGISALQLVATIGWVGLIFTLMRYIPIAGEARRRLVIGVYSTGVGASVLVAVIFTVALAAKLNVSYVSANVVTSAAFCACVAIWVIFTLQDSALISLRRSSVVTVENLLYGALKLILLVALSGLAKPWTLLGIWAASALVFVGVVSGFILLLDPLLRAVDAPPVTLSNRHRPILRGSHGSGLHRDRPRLPHTSARPALPRLRRQRLLLFGMERQPLGPSAFGERDRRAQGRGGLRTRVVLAAAQEAGAAVRGTPGADEPLHVPRSGGQSSESSARSTPGKARESCVTSRAA